MSRRLLQLVIFAVALVFGSVAAGDSVCLKKCGGGGGGGGSGEANTTADVGGGGLSLRGSTPKTGTALNLRTLNAADFDESGDIMSIDDATWATDANVSSAISGAGHAANPVLANLVVNNALNNSNPMYSVRWTTDAGFAQLPSINAEQGWTCGNQTVWGFCDDTSSNEGAICDEDADCSGGGTCEFTKDCVFQMFVANRNVFGGTPDRRFHAFDDSWEYSFRPGQVVTGDQLWLEHNPDFFPAHYTVDITVSAGGPLTEATGECRYTDEVCTVDADCDTDTGGRGVSGNACVLDTAGEMLTLSNGARIRVIDFDDPTLTYVHMYGDEPDNTVTWTADSSGASGTIDGDPTTIQDTDGYRMEQTVVDAWSGIGGLKNMDFYMQRNALGMSIRNGSIIFGQISGTPAALFDAFNHTSNPVDFRITGKKLRSLHGSAGRGMFVFKELDIDGGESGGLYAGLEIDVGRTSEETNADVSTLYGARITVRNDATDSGSRTGTTIGLGVKMDMSASTGDRQHNWQKAIEVDDPIECANADPNSCLERAAAIYIGDQKGIGDRFGSILYVEDQAEAGAEGTNLYFEGNFAYDQPHIEIAPADTQPSTDSSDHLFYDDNSEKWRRTIDADPASATDGLAMLDEASIFCENISKPSPTDTDDHTLWKFPYQVTLVSVDCIVDPADAGDSIDVDIQECNSTGDSCADVDAAAVTCDNDGANDDAISSPVIEADNWTAIAYGTPTGTVDHLSVTVCYTRL